MKRYHGSSSTIVAKKVKIDDNETKETVCQMENFELLPWEIHLMIFEFMDELGKIRFMFCSWYTKNLTYNWYLKKLLSITRLWLRYTPHRVSQPVSLVEEENLSFEKPWANPKIQDLLVISPTLHDVGVSVVAVLGRECLRCHKQVTWLSVHTLWCIACERYHIWLCPPVRHGGGSQLEVCWRWPAVYKERVLKEQYDMNQNERFFIKAQWVSSDLIGADFIARNSYKRTLFPKFCLRRLGLNIQPVRTPNNILPGVSTVYEPLNVNGGTQLRDNGTCYITHQMVKETNGVAKTPIVERRSAVQQLFANHQSINQDYIDHVKSTGMISCYPNYVNVTECPQVTACNCKLLHKTGVRKRFRSLFLTRIDLSGYKMDMTSQKD